MKKKIKKLHEEIFDKVMQEKELLKDLTPLETELYVINRKISLHSELLHGLIQALLYKKILT